MTVDRYPYTFVHNVFGDFIQTTLDYFGNAVYPRFEHQVVGTYDKAVEYLSKKDQYGKELDQPNLPALILNPSGDFNLDDANSGSRQYYRFPNLSPGAVSRVWDPIYQDENVLITVGFTRIKGDIELLILSNSFYELFDIKLLLIQQFGGQGRPIYPRYFNTFFIIPRELLNYKYSNPYTGVEYKLDWDSAGATDLLVKSTARNERVIYGLMKPRYTLQSLADNSSRYGGVDDLADWRLTAQIEYEVEIPSFLVFETDYLAENLHLEIRVDSCYTVYPQFGKPPHNRLITDFHYDVGANPDSHTEAITLPTEAEITARYDLEFNNRYFHTLTQAEVDSTAGIFITLPEEIDNHYQLILNSKYGEMSYSNHYLIENDKTTLEITDEGAHYLNAGDIIEAIVYRFVGPRTETLSGTAVIQSHIRSNINLGVDEVMTATANIQSNVVNSIPMITQPLSGTMSIISNTVADLTRITDLLSSTCIIETNIVADLKVDYELTGNAAIISNVSNFNLIAGTVQDISVSPPGGTYSTPLNITLSTPTSGATIYYTLDGTVPDATDPIYVSPIQLTDVDIWSSKFGTNMWEPFFFDNVTWYTNPPRWFIQDEYTVAFNATRLLARNYRPSKFKLYYDKIYGDKMMLTMYDGAYNIICQQENYQSGQVLDCTFYGQDISGFELSSVNENDTLTKFRMNILSIMFSDDIPSSFTLRAIAMHPTMNPSNLILENYIIN